ncbi:MAG: hypothetical protein RH982_16005 [Parvibaculum sp.]
MTRFTSSRWLVSAFAVSFLAALSGCAETKAPEAASPSRAEAVLDAQYAAKGKPKPMQADEADRIYEEYLKSIGEKSGATESRTTGD